MRGFLSSKIRAIKIFTSNMGAAAAANLDYPIISSGHPGSFQGSARPWVAAAVAAVVATTAAVVATTAAAVAAAASVVAATAAAVVAVGVGSAAAAVVVATAAAVPLAVATAAVPLAVTTAAVAARKLQAITISGDPIFLRPTKTKDLTESLRD
jgi:hypothetical protein